MKDFFDDLEDDYVPSPAEVKTDIFLGQLGALTLGLLVGLLTSKGNRKNMGLLAFVGCFLSLFYKLQGKCPFAFMKKTTEESFDDFDYDDCTCCDCCGDDDYSEEDFLPY